MTSDRIRQNATGEDKSNVCFGKENDVKACPIVRFKIILFLIIFGGLVTMFSYIYHSHIRFRINNFFDKKSLEDLVKDNSEKRV